MHRRHFEGRHLVYQWIRLDMLYKLVKAFFSNFGIIMPPPSVAGDVYCFPRRQLIFIFVRRVIYRLRVCTFRNRFCLSVCTTIVKRIERLCFYPNCLMLYVNGFVSTSSTNENIKFIFELMAENR